MFDGFINVLKPTGMTSNDVVGRLKYLAKKYTGEKIKFGHTGTLDPNAAGVMLVCLGRGTKFSQYVTEKKKTYIGTINLGAMTDTLDTYGVVEEEKVASLKLEDDIKHILNSYLGKSKQIPPKYSALKINGQKLYDLARKGKDIPEIKSRDIEIFNIEFIEYTHPIIKFEVECSAGTYIRSLARDIGEDLGELAHLGLLIRTKVDNFSIDNSYTIEELEQLMQDGNFEEAVMEVDEVLDKFPSLEIKNSAEKAYLNGLSLAQDRINTKIKKDISNFKQKVYNENGQFLGIGKLRLDENQNYILKSETQR